MSCVARCSMCAIIRDSYDLGKTGVGIVARPRARPWAEVNPVGTKHNFSRFGPGIYISARSSSKTGFPQILTTVWLTVK